MHANGWIYRHTRAPRCGTVRVQLGPGQQHYLPGWVNVDANMFTAKCDLWFDLRASLPFVDGTVDAFYSHHVIEHLPDLEAHFKHVHRCLKPGGAYRVGGPNIDGAIQKFAAGDTAWFSDFPDRRNSIGGRFDNFVMCRGEHLHLLTVSFLSELLVKAGFGTIATCLPGRETFYSEWFSDCLAREYESDWDFPHTLIVEARKSCAI
jgi:predicted SAM-dependent methyltransferase